jgi:2-(1,2-epoxy-1,2-dihydrophenyl)acetyl-CoA isomerase
MTESFDRTLADQLAAETNAIAESTRTEDYARGHTAFTSDDDPDFTGQ